MQVPVLSERIKKFESMGFGLFVHWGLYSQLGKGEWFYTTKTLTMPEYQTLQESFTAERFDAEKLVLLAKTAGCKYITLTTRHHEGFSLYDVRGLNSYDSVHAPAKRDLVKEFVEACRQYDIVPFLYHTTLDWSQDDFYHNFDSYLEYLKKSVEILCTRYGEIGGFWFDGNWSRPDNDWKLDELYGMIRALQPQAMIINNTGLLQKGKLIHPEIDSVTFEQGRPEPINRKGMKKYVAAEMCYTLNGHWGIGYDDLNYKSPGELIEALCDCRKVGANFLLNIGPSGQGSIEPIQAEYLKIIGRWMEIFGEAIYKGKPYSICEKNKNFILKDEEGKLYLFVYHLGRCGSSNVVPDGEDGRYAVFSLENEKIEKIEWMDNGEELAFEQTGNQLSVACTGYPYGVDYCVRVARAYVKSNI